MRKIFLFLGILCLVATFSTTPVLAGKPVDLDGDGYNSKSDCDDSDAAVNPGATELCSDGIDNDCNDLVDSLDPVCSGPIDGDGDGYDETVDCNDSDPDVNPGATELCTDSVDNDCNDLIDSADPACGEVGPHDALNWADYPGNCQGCHSAEFSDMSQALHYTWEGAAPDMVNQPGSQQGKLNNALNTYCVNILGDWPVCGTCHVGRGLRPDDSQAGLDNIDCLVCHNADYAMVRTRLPDGSMAPPAGTAQATLDGYVRDIAPPTRTNCLKCHANAGGGDGVKRGDISMADIDNSDPHFDVHMNTGASDLSCQDCHAFVNHKVTGKGSDLRATDYASEVSCVTCHTGFDSGTGHVDAGANRIDADRHINRVSCQACHIDEYAKVATEVYRDWRFHHDGSPADGASGPGHPYSELAANLTPEYLFWNRTSDNALLGDTAVLDPATGAYPTSRPIGDINDGKLYPFKYKTAYQPKVVADDVLISVDTFDFLKVSGDLDTAIQKGLVNMGYPSSEPYELVLSDTYGLLNHGVAPATDVDCSKCHNSWSATSDNMLDSLGYKLKDTPELICSQCHAEKRMPRDSGRMHNHIQKGSGIGCAFCHDIERPERGLCDPCDPACVDEFVDTVPYPHVCN